MSRWKDQLVSPGRGPADPGPGHEGRPCGQGLRRLRKEAEGGRCLRLRRPHLPDRAACCRSTRTCGSSTRTSTNICWWTSIRTPVWLQFRLVEPAHRPGEEHLRGGRRRPEHLPLPRRDHREHPQLRAASIQGTRTIRLEQNYRSTSEHPERRQLRHPAQHRAQGQDPLDEERRGRQGAGLHRRERAGRGHATSRTSSASTSKRADIWPTTPSSTG